MSHSLPRHLALVNLIEGHLRASLKYEEQGLAFSARGHASDALPLLDELDRILRDKEAGDRELDLVLGELISLAADADLSHDAPRSQVEQLCAAIEKVRLVLVPVAKKPEPSFSPSPFIGLAHDGERYVAVDEERARKIIAAPLPISRLPLLLAAAAIMALGIAALAWLA
jgi:hypothetical protein